MHEQLSKMNINHKIFSLNSLLDLDILVKKL